MKKITQLFIIITLFYCNYSHAFSTENTGKPLKTVPHVTHKKKPVKTGRYVVAPINDECVNSTLLTVNTGQVCNTVNNTTAIFTGATLSEVGDPCTLVSPKDIWFEFVATAQAHNIQLNNFTGTPQPVILMLYEGSQCGALTQLQCSGNNFLFGTALTPGNTYKIRAYFDLDNPNLNTTFSICITTPPPPVNNNQADCLIGTVNSDFESPAPPTGVNSPIFLNHNTVQGWRTTASDQIMEFWPSPNYENIPAHSGRQFIELNANLVSGIYQDYSTPETTVFTYSFAHRGRQGTDTCQLLAGPPGGPYQVVREASTERTLWRVYEGTYTVPTGQTVTRFIFQSVSSVGGSSVGNYLDTISFKANNGITSANPYAMPCFSTSASITAAGLGVWIAHSTNPPTTIANPSSNATTITGFTTTGTYKYDWVTQYCTSTLEILYKDGVNTAPTVTNISYCLNETAVPATATTLPGYASKWYDVPTGGTAMVAPPVPTTVTPGVVTYYVSQVSIGGCETPRVPLVVTVQSAAPTVTAFTLPAAVCTDGGTVQPVPAAGFTTGGVYSAAPGLTINPATGAINPATSTPGNYTVNYRIAATACTTESNGNAPIVINALPASVTTTPVQATCTAPVASITVTAPVGTGITYSIDGTTFQPGTAFNNVAPGTYTITAKNAANCTSVSAPVTINAIPVTPAAVTLAPPVQPTCTTATGSITVTAPVGAGITYSIDGTTFQAGTTFNTLAPGTYTITAKNADNCTSSTTATINAQPQTPAVPVINTPTHPTCTVLTGALTVASPTGTGLTYSLDGGTFQAGTSFTVVAPGSHTITVKNAAGCEAVSAPITINPVLPVPGTVAASQIQPTCTTATGTITVTSPLGAGLTYSIDGITFQAGTAFAGIASGSYTITAKNTDNCTSSTVVTINAQPATPAVPVTNAPVHPSCNVPTGVLTIASPIGAGLTYSLDGGAFQAGTTFIGIPPGSHTITVRNAAGCEAVSAPITINRALSVPGAVTASSVQPTCSVGVGSITVTAPLGAGLTYSIDGTTFQAGTSFANVAPGNYAVTVKNTDGCITTAPVTINAQPLTPLVPVLAEFQPNCIIQSGGIAVTSPFGAGYTYSIDNGVSFQASQIFNGLPRGTYTVIARSPSGCQSVSAPVSINRAPVVPGPVTLALVQPTCTVPRGSITVTSPGGPGYTYSMDGGITYQASPTFSNLTPGSHTITANNGTCTSAAVEIINPALNVPASAVLTDIQPTCTTATGTIIVTQPRGPGLTYSINGGTSYQAGTTFNNLAPGNYVVRVKNAAGCISDSAVKTINVQPATPAVAVVTIVPPTCAIRTGSITVSSPTGNDITYSIDNGVTYQAGTTFNGLAPGNYTVTVKNATCTSRKGFVIPSAPQIPAIAGYSTIQPTCSVATGTIQVTSPIGAGISYSIDGGTNFQPGRIFTGVLPGDYTIIVRNSFTCTSETAIITVNNPPAPAPNPGSIAGDGEVCIGGTIQLTNAEPNGRWTSSNPAIATIDANGLLTSVKPGTVIITYTVGTICTDFTQRTIKINELPNPVLRDTYICENLQTGESGSTTLNTGLSIINYRFEWKRGNTPLNVPTGFITVTEPGEYTVTATHLTTGCVGSATATVGVSSPPVATATVGSDFQFRQTITVTVSGGSGDYEYSLNGGDFQNTPYFGNIYDGDHTIIVRDTKGCGQIELNVYALNFPRFFSPNNDGNRDTWNISGLRDQTNAKIYIFDRFGKVITMIRPGADGWDGTFNGTALPATDYWFHLHYQSNGVDKEFKAHFSLLR